MFDSLEGGLWQSLPLVPLSQSCLASSQRVCGQSRDLCARPGYLPQSRSKLAKDRPQIF
jgi:hypothetical protein